MTLLRTFLHIFLVLPFFLVLGTVFADSHSLVGGVVSAKYFWFFASMGCLALTMLFVKSRWPFQMCDLLVFLLVLVQLSVGMVSGQPYAKNKFLLLILLFFLYLYVRAYLRWKPNAVPLFSNALVLIAVLEGIIGGMQLYGFSASNHGLFPMTGTFFNPGPFGGFLGMLFPLAFYQFLHFSNKESRLRSLLIKQFKGGRFRMVKQFKKRHFRMVKRKTVWMAYTTGWLSFVCIVVSVLVLPASMSRASWLGLFAGSLWVMMQYEPIQRRVRSWRKSIPVGKWLYALMLFLFVAVGSLLYFLKPHSVDGRLLMWKQAFFTLIDHPFGVGLGKYGAAVAQAQAAYFESGRAVAGEVDRADAPFFAFNEFLQIGVESGFLALILLLLLLFVSFRSARRSGRHGVFGSLLSLCVFASFSYPFNVLPFLIVFVFLLAMSQPVTESLPTSKGFIRGKKSLSFKWSHSMSFGWSVLSAVLVLTIVFNRYGYYKAYKEWANCKLLLENELFLDASEKFEPLVPYLGDDTNFLYDCARACSESKDYAASNEFLKKAMQFSGDPMMLNLYGRNCVSLKQYQGAEWSFKRAYQVIPNRIYPLYLLGRLYFQTEQYDEAKRIADKVFAHKIVVPSRAIGEMKDSLKEMLKKIP